MIGTESRGVNLAMLLQGFSPEYYSALLEAPKFRNPGKARKLSVRAFCPREAVIGSTTSSELTVGFLSTPKRSRQREGLLRFTSLVLCQILSSAWLW